VLRNQGLKNLLLGDRHRLFALAQARSNQAGTQQARADNEHCASMSVGIHAQMRKRADNEHHSEQPTSHARVGTDLHLVGFRRG
jgi:hypothetical protein